MKRAALLLCVAVSSACSGGGNEGPTGTPPYTPPKAAKWELVWADEFDGTTLDATNWITVDGAVNVNNELEYHLWSGS